LARKGLLDSAHALCLKALGERPDDAFLLLMLGKLGASGKESAEYFKKAIKAGGDSPEVEESRFRLGQYTYASGKYPLAIPYFRDYLRLYPAGAWKEPALYWMGNACLSLAQSRTDRTNYLDSGAAWFRKLLDATGPADYYHSLGLEGLAKAKAAKGDREGAWQAVSEAIGNAPDEERPPLLLLAAQVRQGTDRGTEKSLMTQLVSQYPQSPEARYLRRLNAGADTSRWKSGPGLPRASQSPAKDSLSAAARADTAAKPPDSSRNVTGSFELPQPAVAKPPDTGAGDRAQGRPYTLQCGAFTQAANAQAMLGTLSKLGLAPELVERDRGGKRIYQVRVGRFATADEAEAYARSALKPHRVLSQPVPVAP
jgi:cell division protein FtsN